MHFSEMLKKYSIKLNKKEIKTIQINTGYGCNLNCTHCHVDANKNRTETITKEVIDDCLKFIKNCGKEIDIDITGGAPEKSEFIEYFIKELRKLKNVKRIILRTNLTILEDKKELIDVFKENNVELTASLPCYTKENVDEQRGNGTYEKCINMLKYLNSIGYGIDKNLIINLVYNPLDDYLPSSQKELEKDYKINLKNDHNIVFNNLYTIANIPIGRFEEKLKKNNKYEAYMKLLEDNFNASNAFKVMCLDTINIGYDGNVYDCDFNQMKNLLSQNGKSYYIGDLTIDDFKDNNIPVEDYCYGCTAGEGSSCQGNLS
ncbi:arsenosugar biosynthesis radical SAM protein ArsS [Brachyspira murdochii]|uniref:Radical SAM domain protein n=2 Tax=Brachyspira murdochii TaxID=84378 RepID=D5U6V9_BRAM5|nr:arsenosugar biosynthesis radical SAM (seleno)protein ArsS [Brachyspira murdochii]ADG72683.1 Radical SAM domain protein [Brachyspira murdochii DSM 12563]PPS21335.1 radical SAM protein [Brachyspira murdochii]